MVGETRTYSFERLTRAIRLIEGGARFIATNPDVTGPSSEGSLPATGAVAAGSAQQPRRQERGRRCHRGRCLTRLKDNSVAHSRRMADSAGVSSP